MQHLDLSVFFVVIAGLALLAIGLLMAMHRNVCDGEIPRRQLAYRVEDLDLAQLLRAGETEFRRFIYFLPVHQIEQAVLACEGCAATSECHRCLAREAPFEAFQFCPNYQMVRTLSRRPNSSE